MNGEKTGSVPLTGGANEPQSLREKIRSFIPFLSLVIALFAVRWTLIEPYVVPTGSMEPTLKTGDRLYALKCAYDVRVPFTDIVLFQVSNVKRGDVILFRYPKDPSITFVKRAVAIAGDKILFRGGKFWLNNVEVPKVPQTDRSLLYDIDFADRKTLFLETLDGVRHWVILDDSQPQNRDVPHGDTDEPYAVPEGHVMAVGDNRDNSSDSRSWGPVRVDLLKGRGMFIWFSSWNWRLRPERIGTRIQ